MTATGSESVPGLAPASCRVRTVLNRIGDKWAIYVVDRLGRGPRRFSELLRGIDGITARMLTVTLRGLERDGILTRTVHAAVPPRVDYQLTPLGETLLDTIGQLVSWADTHLGEIEAAQADYDARSCPPLCAEEHAAAEDSVAEDTADAVLLGAEERELRRHRLAGQPRRAARVQRLDLRAAQPGHVRLDRVPDLHLQVREAP